MMYASHTRGCNAPGFMEPTGGVDVDHQEYAVPNADGGATPQLYSYHGHHRVSVVTR